METELRIIFILRREGQQEELALPIGSISTIGDTSKRMENQIEWS
jgi:hypothetical protein